jgi:putative ABC transport system permease protein
VIINQKMARVHWPTEDPLGRRLKIGGIASNNPWFTIVGIVGDLRQMGLDAPAEPEMYFSADQLGGSGPFNWPQYIVVRTRGDPLALSADLRSAVWAADRHQPISNIRSMSQVFDAELLNRNTQLMLVGAFAALALVIAAIGLYGVLSYTVAQQIPEIGVRMALGARRSTVVVEVVRGALALTAAGVGLGLIAAFAVTRMLTAWLFTVSPTDPATFAATGLLLAVVALLASSVPAFRAASVDPSSVLRAE